MADITPIVPLTGELAMPEKVWMQGPPGPQGPQGDTGAAATVTVGTVTTGEPGTDAIVANSGTESAAVLNFTIPRGATGAAGAAGADGVSPTVSTSKSGNVTTITIVDASGTKTATINDGAKGDTGPAGPSGAGVPDGGTVGQLLGKTESGTAWIDPPQSGGGGAADDVYTVKQIMNYDTQTIELQGNYAGALAAFNSGKSLKFVKAIVSGGKEFVDYESFAYYFYRIDSFINFSCYNGHNFPTCKLTESGITVSNDTHVGSLYVDNPNQLYLTSPSKKLFRIKVSDTGELSTEEIT